MRTVVLISLMLAAMVQPKTIVKHYHYHFEGGANAMQMRLLSDDTNRVAGLIRAETSNIDDKDERGFYYFAANIISNADDVESGFATFAGKLGSDNKWNLDCAGARDRLNAIDGVDIEGNC